MSEKARFLAGIAALVADDADRLLLLRRSPQSDFAPGVWECVTGHLQRGEGFEDALHREVREETGLTVTAERLLGTSHFHRGDARPDNELVGVVYACRTPVPERLQLSHEHSDARWVTPGQACALASGDHPAAAWLHRTIERWRQPRRTGGFELG